MFKCFASFASACCNNKRIYFKNAHIRRQQENLQKYCIDENISAFRNIWLSLGSPKKGLVDELVVVLRMLLSSYTRTLLAGDDGLLANGLRRFSRR